MARKKTNRPTDGELAILRVLWSRGPSTVRQVHDELSRDVSMGYTTVLKLMQIMTDKLLLRRDERARAHVYESAQSEGEMQTHLLRDLTDKAFGGSPSQLVMRALSDRRATPEELAEIRRLLEELPGGDH